VNILTVIANESYEDFAKGLQTEIEDECGVKFGGRIKNKRKKIKIKLTKSYKLNEDFKELWERIKHKTKYQVNFNNEDLIKEASEVLSKVEIKEPKIISLKGKLDITRDGVETSLANIAEKKIGYKPDFNLIPNILGYIQSKTKLTNQTIVRIIKRSKKGNDIVKNPQQFMDLAVESISQALQKLIIDGIKYERLQGKNNYWAMELFENDELEGYLENVVKVENKEKTLYDYILVDSDVESEFAKDCESMDKVKFYFKLPFWFKIKTPIGSYNPDWAVVFENDKKVYFVAETKAEGEIRESEKQKILCGERHFAQLDDVKFKRVEKVKQIFE
jgi:type III restriction enzyme